MRKLIVAHFDENAPIHQNGNDNVSDTISQISGSLVTQLFFLEYHGKKREHTMIILRKNIEELKEKIGTPTN